MSVVALLTCLFNLVVNWNEATTRTLLQYDYSNEGRPTKFSTCTNVANKSPWFFFQQIIDVVYITLTGNRFVIILIRMINYASDLGRSSRIVKKNLNE